jgi:HK97 family phage prohead protease
MEMKMHLTFTSDLECSISERTISGKIVPFDGEIGQTSAGKVVFEKGSIEIPDSPKPKLLLEHDAKKPIGRMVSYREDEDGMYATFKISNTTRGTDALIEASEQLRSGLSVGVEVIDGKRDGGVYRVLSSKMMETSLVQAAAFKSAEVLSVAASEDDAAKETTTQNESEAVVEDTTNAVAVAPEVEAPAVEASRPTVTAPIYAKPRLEFTKAKYLENTLRAKFLGDEDAAMYVRAADNETTTAPGMVPTRQLTEVINPLSNADRPYVDAISRGTLPDAGMTFEIPKITAVPTVDQIDENQAIADSQLTASYLSVSVKPFKGRAITTVELIDRSSPVFFDELVRQMEFAYAKETDGFVQQGLASGGVLNATATTEDKDGLLTFISTAAAAIYKGTLGFARNLVVSPEQWAKIMSYNDGGRPIYIAANPQNAGGAISPDSVRGTVAGLSLYVDRLNTGTGNTGLGDYSMVAINPDAYQWFESPRFQLRTNVNSDGTIDLLYYGYGALATKVGAGANWFNKS